MSDRPFLDTNVVLYAFRQGDARSQRAEILLAAGGTLSVQVLNEFVNVARLRSKRTTELYTLPSATAIQYLIRLLLLLPWSGNARSCIRKICKRAR